MEDLDGKVSTESVSDDRLMMSEVICEEADLYYIDCYLRELFRSEE